MKGNVELHSTFSQSPSFLLAKGKTTLALGSRVKRVP